MTSPDKRLLAIVAAANQYPNRIAMILDLLLGNEFGPDEIVACREIVAHLFASKDILISYSTDEKS